MARLSLPVRIAMASGKRPARQHGVECKACRGRLLRQLREGFAARYAHSTSLHAEPQQARVPLFCDLVSSGASAGKDSNLISFSASQGRASDRSFVFECLQSVRYGSRRSRARRVRKRRGYETVSPLAWVGKRLRIGAGSPHVIHAAGQA